LWNVERRIGQIPGQNATGRTRDNAKRRQPSRRAIQAADGGGQALDGKTRESLAHIRPPPGMMLPDMRRCENRQTDWVGTACGTFTGVMLP